MAQISLKQGQVFRSDNRTLYTVINGSLEATYPGGSFSIGAGHTAGILELFQSKQFFIYRVTTDTVIQSFTIPSLQILHDFVEKLPDKGERLFHSGVSQLLTLFGSYEVNQQEYTSLHEALVNDYKQYLVLCHKLQMPAQALVGFDTVKVPAKATDIVLASYYKLLDTKESSLQREIISDAWSIAAFLFHGSLDCCRIYSQLENLETYRAQLRSLYFSSNQQDLLSLNLSLLTKIRRENEHTQNLISMIRFMLTNLEMDEDTDSALLAERYTQFETQLKRLESVAQTTEDSPADEEAIRPLLAGSLEHILDYTDYTIEQKEQLRDKLTQYNNLADKTSTEDFARRLCKELTAAFHDLYKVIALKALADPNPPILVRMFLYFGYLDENLAGIDNACFLYQFAKNYQVQTDGPVYLFFDWLTAIYEGKKEPSRNEFDEEYPDILHGMRIRGNITAQEEKNLLNDCKNKVMHELNNMFPQVNKVTYGRISSYCPIFSAHNVLRTLDAARVTPEKIEASIKQIREVDYRAFFRETIYTNPKMGITKEFIHVEVTPDFILLPNMGTRGCMWQEIENRRRTTPCRMMLSLFHLGELQTTLLRMTGEYRWEMCKRIQGARWNDLSELSLTSEYFDYIQFYRRNSDLSTDAKDKIKTALVKAKNSFKEMFILDYMSWILYESTGSPRLNKVARTILFTYCPFSKRIRDSLGTNPLYRDIFDRYQIKMSQQLHHVDIIKQKLANTGKELPEELLAEYDYIQK